MTALEREDEDFVETEIEGIGRMVPDGGPFGRVLLPRATNAWELPLDILPAPADWTAVYARPAPLVVEIGCGGGRTIMSMAAEHPEWNCMGVERCGEYYRLMRDRAARKQLANFRCARIDAAYLIKRYFSDASVQQYHIYFPDPWPKKKHLKRRLFNDAFCLDLGHTLQAKRHALLGHGWRGITTARSCRCSADTSASGSTPNRGKMRRKDGRISR